MHKSYSYSPQNSSNLAKVLTIAGSDSGGGAGIQADIRTISALGAHSLTAITAITAQNTLGVYAQSPVDHKLIAAQIDAVVVDIGVDAVKIGMLSSPESVVVVVDAIKKYKLKNIILDPVLYASSGAVLTNTKTRSLVLSELLPLVQLVTPNLAEGVHYLNLNKYNEREVDKMQDINKIRQDQMPAIAHRWLEIQNCSTAILLKGGHLKTQLIADYFFDGKNEHWFSHERIASKNLHGTGCTLSTAIATNLAKGLELISAIALAIAFVEQAILAAKKEHIGTGCGPVRQCLLAPCVLKKF